jgi:alpha-amylase
MFRRNFLRSHVLWVAAVLFLASVTGRLYAQGGYNDNRVMIQGFMWESHQKGTNTANGGHQYHVDWQFKWYDHVKSKAAELADAKIDVIWLPPPSKGEGAGYHPHELYVFSNNYGNEQQHKALIHELLKKGIEPVADLVINHRNGTDGWATFKNPEWPSSFICWTDEFWCADPIDLSPEDVELIKKNERGNPDYRKSDYPNWHGARDLDHTSAGLRAAIRTYLKKLRTFGYRGWRYDLVKGFDPVYVAEYNSASKPTFAVGEYWDGKALKVSEWIDGTKVQGQPDPAVKACSAFDFPTQERLKDFINNGKYDHLPAIHHKDGVLDGLIAVNKDKAVTFLENHDTGFPQKQFDSFPNNEKLLQAYAYILTHPGVPCVYWKHYFEWNRGNEIKALIRARKYAGVHSGSFIKSEVHGGDYVGIIGDKPSESSTLIVKIGPGFDFNPDPSIWGLETSGNGYAVWVRKSKKAETKDTVDQPKPALPIPGTN